MKSTPKPSDTLQLIKMVIDKISLQHTTPSKFQLEIEKQIPELVAYVKKDLLYIDPSKPLVVRKEPAYMAELQEHQFRHQVPIKMLIL
jgi:hypothetical protein